MHGIKAATAMVLAATVAMVAQQMQKPVDVQITGYVLKPAQMRPDDQAVAALKLPSGFRITKFAEGLGKPRIIAVANDGTVYVTRREPGDCLMLRDTDGDGRSDQQKVVASKKDLHGVTLDGDRAYFATVKELFSTQRQSDGSFGELKQIAANLPDGGQHPNRTLAIGPDGMLYVSVGSTCNACTETSPESAAILRFKTDGTGREVFASGLRNTIGFAWHPQTKQMWGMDHGIDWLGNDEQGEELNLIEQGRKYGWPYVFANGKFNPQDEPPAGVTKEEWARTSREPAALYTAHAAPMQMAFYTSDQFPPEFHGNAFVAMRGSWNRKPPSGYEVVRIRFQDGKPVNIEPFLTGFLSQQRGGWTFTGRPVGLAVARDGALLIGDDANGVIYRVSHSGSGTRSRPATR